STRPARASRTRTTPSPTRSSPRSRPSRRPARYPPRRRQASDDSRPPTAGCVRRRSPTASKPFSPPPSGGLASWCPRAARARTPSLQRQKAAEGRSHAVERVVDAGAEALQRRVTPDDVVALAQVTPDGVEGAD